MLYPFGQLIPGAQMSFKKKVQGSQSSLEAMNASGSCYWSGRSESRRDGLRLRAVSTVPICVSRYFATMHSSYLDNLRYNIPRPGLIIR